MTAKKQTTVMWLREQFHKVPPSQFGNLFDKALQMEREQIEEAFKVGRIPALFSINIPQAATYYTDTYGE